jgi:hypothetical protein
MRKQVDNITATDLATAYHEAGHACAATLLGGKVGRSVLGKTPRTEYEVLPERCAPWITYAGPYCEAHCLHNRRFSARELHRALAGTSDEKALIAAGGVHLGSGVTPLLERCWPAVEAVAVELLVTGQVDHRDVCAALGLSDDGGPGSFELACIRSGLRAVS